MPLPAQIVAAAMWPDVLQYVVGPYEASAALYVVLVDKTAHVLRCYRSTDGGQTWAEQDAAHAPATATASPNQGANVVLSSTTLYCFQYLTGSSMNVVPFNTATNLWATAIAGPTITLQSGLPLFGLVRSDGSLVIAYQGATEAIMSTGYQRIKLHYHTAAGVWNGPYDVVGSANSPPANTLPGVQTHYYVQGLVLGSSDRALVLYGTNTASGTLSCRVFTSGNVFATVVSVSGTVTPNFAGFVLGQATRYTDGALTKVAVPVMHSNTGLDIARCDTATAETAANWSVESTGYAAPETGQSTPAALGADTKKLWLMLARATERTMWYANDAAAATWSDLVLWKDGDQVMLNAFCVQRLSSGLGVVYYDGLGAPTLAQVARDTDVLIGYSDTGAQNRAYQKFHVPVGAGGGVSMVRLRVRKVGAPTNTLSVVLMTDNAGVPGTALASAYTSSDTIGTSDAWARFFPSVSTAVVSADTDYWLAVLNGAAGTSNSTTDYWVTRAAAADVYAGGNLALGTSAAVLTQQGGDLAFLLYPATASPRIRFDRLDIYASKVSAAVGTGSTIIDLGDPPPDSYTVYADVGDNADPAGTVEIAVEQSWDQGAWMPAGNCGPLPVQALDGVALAKPARFIKVTTTVTGSTSVVGTSGV